MRANFTANIPIFISYGFCSILEDFSWSVFTLAPSGPSMELSNHVSYRSKC